jgi:hypothetical protein
MASTYAPGAAFRPPPLPASIYTDPQFDVDDEGLRQEISARYAELAKQLGYLDDQGNAVPGTVELGANSQRAYLNQLKQQAIQDVTNDEQSRGTLWSGVRADHQARAEQPLVQSLGELEMNTGNTLSDLYTNVMGLADEYRHRRSQALLDAIGRRGTPTGEGGTDPGTVDPGTVDPGGVNVPADPAATGPLAGAGVGAAGGTLPPPNPQVAPPPAAVQPMMNAATPQSSAAPPPPAAAQALGDLHHTITIKHPSGHVITHSAKPLLQQAGQREGVRPGRTNAGYGIKQAAKRSAARQTPPRPVNRRGGLSGG